MSNAQADWYDDGSGSGTKRWWDGNAWTDQLQPPAHEGGIAGVADWIQATMVFEKIS